MVIWKHRQNLRGTSALVQEHTVFSPPLGQAGMDYVNENTRLLHAYKDMTPFERVALQAILVMLGLLLQKLHPKLGAKEFSRHLARCLALWKEGKIMELLAEACTIQSRLPEWDSCSGVTTEMLKKRFAFSRHGNLCCGSTSCHLPYQ